MVKNKLLLSQRLKTAFTMIELIFAILIISISMLTLPAMMRVDAKNQEASLYQEGIMLTTTKIAQALTFYWDVNSQPLAGAATTSLVLNTNGDAELSARDFLRDSAGNVLVPNVLSDFRVGHFQEQLRRRLTPASNQLAAAAIGGYVNPSNSISDLNGDFQAIGIAAGQTSYKKQWQLTTLVTYVADNTNYAASNIAFNFSTAPIAGPTNIKMVQITAIDVTPGAPVSQGVRLYSYSANIGEAEFFKRRY